MCAVRTSDGQYFIQKRPEKGLLAGMWEFPSHTLPDSNDSTTKQRKQQAAAFAASLLGAGAGGARGKAGLKHVGELGSVPWLFSHLKLTMHVHLFTLDGEGSSGAESAVPRRRWASSEDVESETMGTGMRKCWGVVKEA